MSIISLVGGPGTVSVASGGKIYAYNTIADNANTTVAPANTARKKITFHNPGTVDVLISPALAYNGSTNSALSPGLSTRGGCFLVYANGGTLIIEGECQGAWRALALSGSTNPLTVMDSNV